MCTAGTGPGGGQGGPLPRLVRGWGAAAVLACSGALRSLSQYTLPILSHPPSQPSSHIMGIEQEVWHCPRHVSRVTRPHVTIILQEASPWQSALTKAIIWSWFAVCLHPAADLFCSRMSRFYGGCFTRAGDKHGRREIQTGMADLILCLTIVLCTFAVKSCSVVCWAATRPADWRRPWRVFAIFCIKLVGWHVFIAALLWHYTLPTETLSRLSVKMRCDGNNWSALCFVCPGAAL